MLKRRKKRDGGTGEMGGQDSFLDIVSNIVGILIILVMIAGVRAQQSSPEPDETPVVAQIVEAHPIPELPSILDIKPVEAEPKYADEAKILEIEEKYRQSLEKTSDALRLRQGLDEVLEKTEEIGAMVKIQALENKELFEIAVSARTEIQILAGERDQETKEKIELQRQIREIEAKMGQVDKTKQWIQANRPKATVLENIPTPISKTVEEKEAHFRLMNGKIVYVPIPELLDKIQAEFSSNQQRFKNQKSTTGRVGPVNDFLVEYNIISYDAIVRSAYGMGVSPRIELENADFIPVNENLGQPLREALGSPDSDLTKRLQVYRQDIYTITLWVYPDSFEEFQELKKFLYSKGYRVAARPKEFGQAISGSSIHGTKSSSQ